MRYAQTAMPAGVRDMPAVAEMGWTVRSRPRVAVPKKAGYRHQHQARKSREHQGHEDRH